MRHCFRLPRAFTLIELLICIAIIPIIFAAGFTLYESVRTMHARLAARTDALEAADRAVAVWRADVQAASHVIAEPGGQIMRIRRVDAAGSPVEAIYAFDQGRLIRRREPALKDMAPEQVLVTEAKNGAFERTGRLWRIRWQTPLNDGIQIRALNHGALAAALAVQEVAP